MTVDPKASTERGTIVLGVLKIRSGHNLLGFAVIETEVGGLKSGAIFGDFTLRVGNQGSSISRLILLSQHASFVCLPSARQNARLHFSKQLVITKGNFGIDWIEMILVKGYGKEEAGLQVIVYFSKYDVLMQNILKVECCNRKIHKRKSMIIFKRDWGPYA
ncbi:hypothetical protein LXL04_007711 [Taraxacum kok-saghyz]